MVTDPDRPRYHFVPPGGTLHDPNGACYWNGRYHLFYQYWPPSQVGERPWREAMHWGHAVSEDLVTWQDLPIALAPDPGPELSCYSGQSLVEPDRLVLMYHGPGAGNCIATATDEFAIDIEKHPANPVIPMDEDAPYRVFDPCIWREDGWYYSLSGSHADGDRGEQCRDTAYLFRSPNLEDWEYLHPLFEGGFHTEPGEDAAVPNFFPVDRHHLLLFFSHTRGPQYYLGRYERDASRFTVHAHGRMNAGPVSYGNLHAPSVLADPDGRRVAVFNIREARRDEREAPWRGWQQVLSLPRKIDVQDGAVTVEPVSELAALRRDHQRYDDVHLANQAWVVPDPPGESVEVRASIDPGDAEEIGISVLRSPNGDVETTVSVWPAAHTVGIDPTRAIERADVLGRPPELLPLECSHDSMLELQIFVDRGVVEAFVNRRQALTARVYPDHDRPHHLGVYTRGGTATLRRLDIWQMDDIWA